MGSKQIFRKNNVVIKKAKYKTGKSIYWVHKLPYITKQKKFHKLKNARKYANKIGK